VRRGMSAFNVGAVALGFAFLYLPIVILVIYSFNASRLVAVWGGWSTRWYGELAGDAAMLESASISLAIAFFSAGAATVLGTLAAVALTRAGRFPGRLLLGGMVYAPLVMPEVITGLSLLLLFVAMEQAIGWPAGRGLLTIVLSHTTFTMAYVAVVMQSRLASLDQSLEEAAQDLGARPLKVFFVITVPIVFPAILSGWLLSFTLSLDDLVTSSFVTGPGATTLPMVIFSKVRLGLNPEINALATIIIALVGGGVVIASLLMSQQERRRQRDVQMAIAANQ
jgi:putrescine transport system permease protein